MQSAILKDVFRLCYNIAWKFRGLSAITQRILHRVVPIGHLYNRFLLQPSLPNENVVLPFDGQQILVHNPRKNVIGQEIFLRGCWEPEVTEYVCDRIRSGMTVLDVGADIGYYTLLFAKRVGPQGRILAFEPIPEALATLNYNIRLNRYQNVTVLEYGLYNENGSFILEGPLDVSRINPARSDQGKKDLTITTRVFDECARELGIRRIDLVKIDVEGAEMSVLEGMIHTLKAQHPALLVEVHPMYLGLFGHGAEGLIRFLWDMEYSIHPVDHPVLDLRGGNITIYCC